MKKINFPKNRPLLMGVLNITPDSFSDGGKFNTFEKALKRVEELEREGADIIDIGGESTGPNSKNVPLEEELNRVVPLIKKLRPKTKLLLSVDTYKAEVANQALLYGADLVNDVTALRGDSKMAAVIKDYKCPVVLMFSKDNTPRTTVEAKQYKNIVKTVLEFFEKRIEYSREKGIEKSQIILDPGMGQFLSAIPRYSFEILVRLKELQKMGYPLLIGASRKSFLGGEMKSRDERTQVANAIAYLNGAAILRIHNVKMAHEFFAKFNR